MKRNFKTVVQNFDGQPCVRPVFKFDETGMPVTEKTGQQVFDHYEPMTYRTYALDALSGRWRGEENMAIDDIMKRGKLIEKLTMSMDGVVEIDADESKMIVDCLIKQGRDVFIIAKMKAMLDKDPE